MNASADSSSSAELVVWAVDVDGTIVDSMTGRCLRPGARDLLVKLNESGAVVVLWSAGGVEHARWVAQFHALEHFFSGIYSKSGLTEGRLSLDHLPTHHWPSTVLDDRPEEAPQGTRAVPVKPYMSADPSDDELLHVLRAL